MITEGVNDSRTRSIYYGIAVSSLGCIAATSVLIWSLPSLEGMTRWEDKEILVNMFLLAGLFLYHATLVIRSLCVPIPTVTTEYRMRGATWSFITVYIMFFMFFLSHKVHSIKFCIYVIGVLSGEMAVRQLNWPVRDFYIRHLVLTDLLCCVSCYLGYQPHEDPAFYVLIGLTILGIVVNHILNKVLLPSTDGVHDNSRFRYLYV